MKKFWNIAKTVNGHAEIYIYGEIVSRKGLLDKEGTSAVSFREDLEALNGADITVKINSPGGDVFAAQAIHNQLRAYKGNVTAVVDGVAASAASVIVMGAGKIIMPRNALMMIHNPAIYLDDIYNVNQLSKEIEALQPIKESIVSAYMRRATCSREEISHMMDEETWLTAEDCVALGLADVIDDDAQGKPVVNNGMLCVNNLKFDTKHFRNIDGLTSCLNKTDKPKEREKQMSIKISNLINFLNGVGLEVDDDKTVAPVAAPEQEPVDAAQVAEDAVRAERERVAQLDDLTNGAKNGAAIAIINLAKSTGKTVNDIQEYVDAVSSVVTPAEKQLTNMVEDAHDSGVENIEADPEPQDKTEADEIRQAANAIAKFFNKK